MQTGKCLLVLNEFKSKIPKTGVTPMEVQLLIHMHHSNAGQMPIENLEIDKEPLARTALLEKKRLSQHYITKHDDKDRVTVESVYPGTTFKAPETFADVTDIDGNPVFGKSGSPVAKKIKLGDKEFTEEELLALTKQTKSA